MSHEASGSLEPIQIVGVEAVEQDAIILRFEQVCIEVLGSKCPFNTEGDIQKLLSRFPHLIHMQMVAELHSGVSIQEATQIFLKVRKETGLDHYYGEAPILNTEKLIIRASLVHLLQGRFSPDPKQSCRVVLSSYDGLGGVGKTQLALQYYWDALELDSENHPIATQEGKYRYKIWWQASSRSQLIKNYLSLGIKLGLAQEKDDEREIITRVQNWFADHSGWLLILDDAPTLSADDPETHIEDLVPNGGGHILITSRSPYYPNSITVREMLPEEALLLFSKITDKGYSGEEEELLKDLINILGTLPLAVSQAASYIAQTHITLQEYFEQYIKAQENLLVTSDRPEFENGVLPIAVTWDISRREIAKHREYGAIANSILDHGAYLAPENISILILRHSVILKDLDSHQNLYNFSEAIRLIQDYSLIQRGEHCVAIHCVLQEAIRQGHLERQHLENMLHLIIVLSNDCSQELNILPHFLILLEKALRYLGDPVYFDPSDTEKLKNLYLHKFLTAICKIFKAIKLNMGDTRALESLQDSWHLFSANLDLNELTSMLLKFKPDLHSKYYDLIRNCGDEIVRLLTATISEEVEPTMKYESLCTLIRIAPSLPGHSSEDLDSLELLLKALEELLQLHNVTIEVSPTIVFSIFQGELASLGSGGIFQPGPSGSK